MKPAARLIALFCLAVAPTLLAPPAPARSASGAGGSPAVYLPIVSTAPRSGPSIDGCPIFPADNIWNARVDQLPVDRYSAQYIQSIGPATHFHADFGSGEWEGNPMGIPYVVVPGTQPLVPVHFYYAAESDPGPYPIPANPPIEGGSDRHMLVLEKGHCTLYELFSASPQPGGSWSAGSGAVFDLNSNALRPDTWTSADAAGLSILAGLARYDEFAAGEIRHALRFTAANTQKRHVWPARHDAPDETSTSLPPMGQRFRLKASFDITGFTREEQVFLKAFKTYGIILADNGSDWYVSGAPDDRWDNDMLHNLFSDTLVGSNFEAVDSSSLMVDPDSGQAH